MDDITSELLNRKRKKLKKWWEQLSQLERNLIVSLTVVGTVLLLLTLILITQGARLPKTCTTRQCLLAASKIATRTNPTIDPCYDFYQFTCQKSSELDNNDRLTAEQVEDQLIDILTAPSGDDRDDVQLAEHRELFRMCLDKSTGEESFRELRMVLDELHGWPVVLGYQWKAGSFEWKGMIREMRKMGLPFNMLISMEVAPWPNSPNLMLHIKKPEVPKVAQEFKHDYRKFMQEVAMAFGSERSRALNDMKRVLDFITELNKLTERSQRYEKHRLIDIQRYFKEVDWVEFLNDLLKPSATITIDDYVITPGHKYLHEFFSLLNRTPKRIQANYILWTVVEQFLPFLSERLKTLQSNYAHLTGSVQVSPERWHLQQCYTITRGAFVAPPAEVAFVRQHQGREEVKGVVQLAENVKTALEMFLKETQWINSGAKVKTLEKLHGVNFVETSLGEESLGEVSLKSGFLHRYLEHVTNKVNQEYRLNESKRFHYHPLYNLEVEYLAESNSIVLPIGLYSKEVPIYLNYGELGAIISRTLAHAMLHNEDEQFWTANYNESLKCVNLQNGDPADLIGVQLAYAAYQIWVHDHHEEDGLIGLDHTSNQLAWIASVLGYCQLLNKLDGDFINGVVKNDPNFKNDFNCPWGSPMGPLRRCALT